MSDYISREAVVEFIRSYRCCTDVAFHMEHHLNEIPAADVRPVVLCRDCKCYQQSHYIDNHMECARSGFSVHSVDFCSFGEKEGGKLMADPVYTKETCPLCKYDELEYGATLYQSNA